jgi:chromosome segregation ATPase
MGKIRDLFRWRPSKKRRTAAQISGLQKAQSASVLKSAGTSSDKENTSDRTEKEVEKLEERAERYEQKYRNERKKTGRMARNLKAVKQKLCDMTSSHNSSQNLLQEVQAQLDKKDREVLQLENSKQHLEKRNGGLHTHIRRTSRQKDRAVEKAVEEERKQKTEFHTQEKGVITEVSRAMMRDLVSLGVKANSVDAAVGCIAGHLGTKIEGKFTR